MKRFSLLSAFAAVTLVAAPARAAETQLQGYILGISAESVTIDLGASHGLKAGDIIVEFGGQKIANIYDYTYAMDAVKIGQPVKVVVTSVLPPNTGVVTDTASPFTAMSTLLVSTVRSSLTDRRDTTSRPS